MTESEGTIVVELFGDPPYSIVQSQMNIQVLLLWAAVLSTATISCGQEPTITTIAGTGQSADNGSAGKGLEINIGDPFGVEDEE